MERGQIVAGSKMMSFRATSNMCDVLETLIDLDFKFPLGEPINPKAKGRWLEMALAWFIAAALRQEISEKQLNSCVSPDNVLGLWLAFVKAKNKEKGYGFTSEDPKNRQVTVPEGKAVHVIEWGTG